MSIEAKERALAKALKTPIRGWGRTKNKEKLLASLCDILARLCCLTPAQVFDWAKRHSNYDDLRQASARLTAHPEQMELLEAVLNDLPLNKE